MEKAYQFEVPEFREKVSIIEYLNRFKLVKYLEADVSEIDIKDKGAKIVVNVTYIYMLKKVTDKKMKRLETERWEKIKGVWYHIPEGWS